MKDYTIRFADLVFAGTKLCGENLRKPAARAIGCVLPAVRAARRIRVQKAPRY